MSVDNKITNQNEDIVMFKKKIREGIKYLFITLIGDLIFILLIIILKIDITKSISLFTSFTIVLLISLVLIVLAFRQIYIFKKKLNNSTYKPGT